MRAALAASLLLTTALPAAGQRPDPAAAPWGVEAPGSLGARFGLGVDLLLDRLDDLEATAGRQTVTFRGPGGGEETTVVPFDPRLDDRKHGRDWEERSVGFQVPIALPPLRFGRGLSIEPSLVIEAAAVDGRFTVDDLVEGRPDRHLDGTGARWGAGVQALGGLCRDCRWFWGAGYRFRSLGGLEVDGPAPADAAGLAVTERTEIDHDAHHLTARLGALVASGRATVYVGVRRRQSDLVVEDETTLRFLQARPDETVVATRLDLEADDTTALAGTDFRLGGAYVARVEATFGGEGEGVLLKVVRAHHWQRSSEPADVVEERRRRAAELARQIVPGVRRVLEMLEDGRRRLERQRGSQPAWDSTELRRLLETAATELDAVLDEPELEPLQAWFHLFFTEAGTKLEGAAASGAPAVGSLPSAHRGLAFAALQPPERVDPNLARQRDILDSAIAQVSRLLGLAGDDELKIDLIARSCPRQDARINLSTPFRSLRQPHNVNTIGRLEVVFRGLYTYEATLEDRPTVACDLQGHLAKKCKLVDLWIYEGPYLICDFRKGREECTLARTPPRRCPER